MQIEEFLQGHPEWFEVSAGNYPSWLEYASENRVSVHNLWKLFEISNSIVIESPGLFATKREYQYDGSLSFREFMDCCEAEWGRRKQAYGTLDYVCSERELALVPTYYERAEACYEQVDLDGAVFYLKLCASAGDAPSCQKLGHICFLLGERYKANAAQAAGWYRLGSSCGDMDCLSRLAGCLLRGEGTDRDPKRAVSLLELLAERGCHQAAADLGRLYLSGEAVASDYEKAKLYLEQARAAGYVVDKELDQLKRAADPGYTSPSMGSQTPFP